LKRYILLRLFAIQVAIIVVLLVAGLIAAHGTGRGSAVWITAAIATVAAGGVSYLIARVTVRPMRDLIAAFRQLSAGEFDVRVRTAKRGRLRELGDDFNEMAFKTKTLVAELRQQSEALDAIVGSIQEGLAVLDNSGVIVLANESFRRICADRDAVGKHYWEVIRDPHVAGLLKAVGADQPTVTRRCDLGGRDYVCSAGFLPAAERLVLTLHDVTEIGRTAEVKRDFVQNVSHELRTPLTAIKGFAETMETTIDKGNRPYLETIIRNTDRLVSLVQDLLTLSELEERGAELQLEEVNLKEIAAQMLTLFEKAARDKGLELRLTSPGEDISLRADRFKLEQVFINLLDNAIKYTEKGEVEVTLGHDSGADRNASGGGRAVIEVRDTGPGIAAEHLPRIFERFYVVDKGRSRQLGGTGLGLSIVKHIVLLHGGDVSVRSTPGAGTTVTVSLPVRTA